MAGKNKNIAASVHERLLNKAKASSRPFSELLQHFAIERFLYRLSKSPHADRFVLKGALMFSVWSGPVPRPTMDIDLLGRLENSLENLIVVMKDACRIEVEDDGMLFNGETVAATSITEDAEYRGVRVRLKGRLGKIQTALQVDVGFGDVIVPAPTKVVYPSLLDFPSPELKGYTMETTIAEKFQAMVKLGLLNSRMKDFYDIWILSHTFDFKNECLVEAVKKTFENRRTALASSPTVFDPSFGLDRNKQSQWDGFLRKSKLDAPRDFSSILADVKGFLEPIVFSALNGQVVQCRWEAPGPWR